MPPRQPPPAASIFAFIIFLWIILSPESPSQYLSLGNLLSERFERHQSALAALNASSWGDFLPPQTENASVVGAEPGYLNLTGFREVDGFAWEDLTKFRTRCEEWSRRVLWPLREDGKLPLVRRPVWQNATGAVKGSWARKDASSSRTHEDYNLTASAPDHAWHGLDFSWSRNITGGQGSMVIDIVDTGRNVKEHEYGDEAESDPSGTGGKIRTAKASVEIDDAEGDGASWEMRMHGVQWPRIGAMLLTTTSEKFDGIFGLPHLTNGPDFFRSSQELLNETLGDVVRKESSSFFADMNVPWSSEVVNPQQEALSPSPRCEFILYAQVHSPTMEQMGLSLSDLYLTGVPDILENIEQELRFPNGAPIAKVPELQMSAILWSPDCAFFLETKGPPEFPSVDGDHLVGNKIEVIYGQIRLWVLVFAGVFLGQTFLLKDQMRESPTPSTIWRISYASISMMVTLDGITFGAATIWALDAGITFLESLALLFAAFLSMAIGALFLSEIHKVQVPADRRRPERDAPANRSTPRPPPTPHNTEASPGAPTPALNSGPETAPTDGTPDRPRSPPIIIPSDQDIDAEINSLPAADPTGDNNNTANQTNQQQPEQRTWAVLRYALSITAMLLFIIFSSTWSSRLRSLFSNALILAYLSFWLPQIHRNVMRNCRRALTWRFMIGQSILRLVPIAYFYLKEDNFLLAEPDRHRFLVYCAWVWVQLWVLAFQDVLGPRFGVPKSWTPEAWDYHPVLREDNLEDGSFPVGLLSSLEPVQQTDERAAAAGGGGLRSNEPGFGVKEGAPTATAAATMHGGRGKRSAKTECAICFDVLEVPVIKAGEADAGAGGVAGVLTRRNYMVTPCRHIFHSPCLESWLRYRLKCPICRDDLPPL